MREGSKASLQKRQRHGQTLRTQGIRGSGRSRWIFQRSEAPRSSSFIGGSIRGRARRILGTVLLNRTTRQVTLSDAGIVYFLKAKKLLDDLADADSLVADRGDEPSGPLRVSVPVSYGSRRIAPHIAAFLSRYPKLDLDSLTELIL